MLSNIPVHHLHAHHSWPTFRANTVTHALRSHRPAVDKLFRYVSIRLYRTEQPKFLVSTIISDYSVIIISFMRIKISLCAQQSKKHLWSDRCCSCPKHIVWTITKDCSGNSFIVRRILSACIVCGAWKFMTWWQFARAISELTDTAIGCGKCWVRVPHNSYTLWCECDRNR